MAYPLDADGDGYYDSISYDADGDGFADTVEYGGGYGGYGGYGDGYGYDDYGLGGGGGYGLGGGGMPGGWVDDYGGGGAYGGYGGYGGGYDDYGYGGWGDGYDLYDGMSWMDREMPLYEAWGDYGGWGDDQYMFADLLHYQRQLEMDTALNEQERLRRWEERLRWEELDEAERSMRYRSMDPYALSSLGLSGGFWGHRLGGRSDLDLGYLRNLNLTRGLFSAPYRSHFVRHANLGRRYMPYFSRSGLRPYAGRGGFGLGGGGGLGRGMMRQVPPRFGSRPIAGDGMLSLREQELRTRLRIAETRASLTGLAAAQRAQALNDARMLKEELLNEQRLARTIDRDERRTDALDAAREAAHQRREIHADREHERDLMRLEQMAVRPPSRGLGGMGRMRRMSGGYGGVW
ncbi:hypothetical protein BCR35DRAFT_329787 [Leucosporidium creatinivorum]|uniref:Uncharacterized protein n=1 Tax=Leucosporidium creatinivorum TaxID=106004 RepID=A0A1Y2G0B6_9BASI|nr:hypothetical protein BCR35DRAFT_329787 [Leucosporidium creatinivorum]